MNKRMNEYLAKTIPYYHKEVYGGRCCYDEVITSYETPDFTSEKDWTIVLLWAYDDSRHPEWTWQDFMTWAFVKWHDSDVSYEARRWGLDPSRWKADSARWLINPENFAPTLVEFLKKNGKKKK